MATPDAKELFEKFRTHWQCYACKVPPGPKERKIRYLCLENSHPLCVNCKDSCPCKSRINYTRKPADFLAEMMDIFPWYHCSNYENGCRELLEEKEYENHVKNCTHRRVNCVYLSCQETVLFKNAEIHFKTHIKEENDLSSETTEWHGEGWAVPMDLPLGSLRYLKPLPVSNSKERICYFIGYKPTATSDFYFWVYMLGSPNETDKFLQTFTVQNPNSSEVISFTANIHTVDKHFSEIVKNEEAFRLGEQTIRRNSLVTPKTKQRHIFIAAFVVYLKDIDIDTYDDYDDYYGSCPNCNHKPIGTEEPSSTTKDTK